MERVLKMLVWCDVKGEGGGGGDVKRGWREGWLCEGCDEKGGRCREGGDEGDKKGVKMKAV